MSSLFGAIRHICPLLNKKTKKMIYYSHFQSALNYLNIIWANTSKFNLNRLNKLLTRIKLSMGHVDTEILNFTSLVKLEQCKLIQKILQKTIKTNVPLNPVHSTYNIRKPFKLAQKKCRTNLGSNSPIQSSIRTFNSLPKYLLDNFEQRNFVKLLKKHLCT